MFQIEEELKKLPAKPGVYLMHDERDEIIMWARPSAIKNRVRQYFQSSRNKGAKIEQMVTHIARFEYIITDSELEALVLESNLIKEHRPKYNTMLKDDKSYPFIKVTIQEAYPRVLFARRMKKDKNRYFWSLYKCRGCKRCDRAGAEAVPGQILQQNASKRLRKGQTLSVLPYEAVYRSLYGKCVSGSVQRKYPEGTEIPQRRFSGNHRCPY